MATAWIRIDLLEPVIASVGTATAAAPKSLPFLPGAMLWGALVSKAYASGLPQEQVFRDYYGPRLRISDGLSTIHGNHSVALPAPRSLHQHKLTKNWQDWAAPRATRAAGYKQAKEMQIGPGPNIKVVTVKTVDTQRTAIDPNSLRADDGQFFGIQALAAGQSFFSRIDGQDDLVETALSNLCGERFFGRSRNAEFGKVRICKIDPPSLPSVDDGMGTFLWCLSDMAAIDRYFQPTERPEDPGPGGYSGLFGAAIDWSRSFVRHRTYSPFNTQWNTRQPERLVIERGSVIVLKSGIKTGVHSFGLYQSQGLGQVLVSARPPLEIIEAWSPAATESHSKPTKALTGTVAHGKNVSSAGDLLNFLDARSAKLGVASAARQDVSRMVDDWFDLYGKAEALLGQRCGPTASQWGAVVQFSGAMLSDSLKDAHEATSERERTSWQARFDLSEKGTFIAALLDLMENPEHGETATEREKLVRLLAHGLRRKLIKEGYFDGA